MSNLYIGIMSGTSFDGIDIALCRISKEETLLLDSFEYPFDEELKKELMQNIGKDTLSFQKFGELDIALAKLYLKALEEFFTHHTHYKKEQIEAIGLHGQTLWHQPKGEHRFSLQLGSGAYLYAKMGIKVVNDFRNVDVALGGNGAPFAPAFHKEVLYSKTKKRAVVNIGGMANITILDDEVRGWDSGCGNVLLDYFIQKTQQKSYDKDGTFARSGEVDEKLLTQLLNDPYFLQKAPKSTGREYFNAEWLKGYLLDFSTLSNADIQRTLLELTAKSLAEDLKPFHIDQIILCGGGAKNSFLCKRIEILSQTEVVTSDELGISSDFMEAMAFAWLAYKRVNGQKVLLKSITGAKKDALLGCVYGFSSI